MNVPNHDKVKFKDMTPEERSAIVEAWLKNGTEEIVITRDGNERWGYFCSIYKLKYIGIYRTKPRQLVIPWEHIKPDYKWASMDSDGEVILHAEKPVQSNLGFVSDCERVADMLNIDISGIDWRNSLVQRPEGNEQ